MANNQIQHTDAIGQPIEPGAVVISINDGNQILHLVTKLSEKRIGLNGYPAGSDPRLLLVVTTNLVNIGKQCEIDNLLAQYGSEIDYNLTLKDKPIVKRYVFDLWTAQYWLVADTDLIHIAEIEGTSESDFTNARNAYRSTIPANFQLAATLSTTAVSPVESPNDILKLRRRLWMHPHVRAYHSSQFSAKRVRALGLDVPSANTIMTVAEFNTLLNGHPATLRLGRLDPY